MTGSLMTYVDGFLIPLPKNKVNAYRKMARQGASLWMKHGALEYRECVADDLKAFDPEGKSRPSLFPKMAGAKRSETVVFAYVVYESKAHRNRVNKKVMSDPSMKGFDMSDMPFDMERMGYAGFKTLVEAPAGQTTRAARRRPPAKRSIAPQGQTLSSMA